MASIYQFTGNRQEEAEAQEQPPRTPKSRRESPSIGRIGCHDGEQPAISFSFHNEINGQ